MSTDTLYVQERREITMEKLRNAWKNEYLQTGVMILVIIIVVFGFWFGIQIVLNTQYPALAVASGSMCRVQRMHCDGWTHPFDTTLHVGDLIIVQGVSPEDIHADEYPHGDIIVFRQTTSGELIVHRAIAKVERDGKWYFQTKGDGNSTPDSPSPNTPEENVEGKVIMRIPWIGHIALFMRNSSGIYIIILLIVILVIVEFIIPAISKGKKKTQQEIEDEKARA
jgi:signal peptidase I